MGQTEDKRESDRASDLIADIVRRRDMDRYLAILLSPRDKQPALMALAAFHCELGHISHAASEPSLVAIRFQWWRDALQADKSGEKTRTGNPVADILAGIVRSHDLPMELISEMLDAHEGIDSGIALQAPLFELSALILGGDRSERLRQASIAAARACEAAMSTEGKRQARTDMSAANRQQCAALLGELPAVVFPAFLPVSLTQLYLSGPIDNPLRNLQRFWYIWRAHRKKTLD